MVTGWQTINYYSYYFDSNGAMVTGWLCYNGSWYYFKQGKMQRNCIAPDGSYLGADGISRKIR